MFLYVVVSHRWYLKIVNFKDNAFTNSTTTLCEIVLSNQQWPSLCPKILGLTMDLQETEKKKKKKKGGLQLMLSTK